MIYKNEVTEYINFIDDLDNRGKDLIKLVDELMFSIRDILVGNKKIDIPVNNLLEYINLLNELSYKMRLTNYPKILLETFIISINKSIPNNINKTNESIETKEECSKEEIKIEQIEEVKEKVVSKEVENNQEIYDNSERKIIKEINTLETLKKIRINNTLSICDKLLLNELKENWKQIAELLLK